MKAPSDIAGLAYDGALRYRPARLWLDGRPRGEIAFAARVMALPPGRGRLLCAEALAALLPTAAARPLALPYGRSLQLGPARLRLTPAGSGPGSAVLRLETDAATVLIATAACPRGLRPGPALDLGLAVDVIAVDTGGAAAGAEAFGEAAAVARLAALRLRAGGGLAYVGVDDAGLMLALARLAAQQGPVRLEGSWQALARRLDAADRVVVGPAGRRRRDVIVFCSARRLERAPAVVRLRVGPGVGAGAGVGASIGAAADATGSDDVWRLDWRPSIEELAALIAAAGATRVVALGAAAAALASRLGPKGPTVFALDAPQQLTLW